MSPSYEKLRGLRILVAEDDALILMDIEEMLREIGCKIVGPVSTVAAALAAIEENELDGALLDMNLHGERISPAADELLARGVQFILCTGYSSNTKDKAAIQNAPRLTKPFNLKTLRAAMNEAFGHSLDAARDDI